MTVQPTSKADEAVASSLPPVVVMGVSGCGKTVVGLALAQALGASFIEGDQLHPPENVALMASGTPLTDGHRAGWLDTIGREIAAQAASGTPVVAACSALKRIYRDRLRAANPSLMFVHLKIDKATARERVGGRSGHFMPPSLVDSQFAALEVPAPDERALELDALLPIGELAEAAAAFLQRQPPAQAAAVADC